MTAFNARKTPYIFAVLVLVFLFSFKSADQKFEQPKILVFTKTLGWHHSSIPFGIAAMFKLGRENGFQVDTTTNSALFNDDNLKHYRAVVFLSTTGNVLNGAEQAAFERYIQAGGGFVGIHAAADTEYGWPWYGKLVGAWFESHPSPKNVRKAMIDIVDKNNPATAGLSEHWTREDEWYNYRSFYPGLKVLADLDEGSYEGGTNGTNHHISWYHEFDGGRAFYTGCGHTDQSFSEPLLLSHILGGIKYAMGNDAPLDYSKAYSVETLEQNRFVKTILVSNLNSPMELAAASDGRVFFTELFGELNVYNTRTSQFKLIHKFPVTTIGGMGVIGLNLDPHFDTNGYLYIYYAPAGQSDDALYFQLSRFTLKPSNMLDLASEKILLKVPVQKNSGSHHGGSIAWDKEGNLYLSTGDSSSPFPSNGYSPMDERPGKDHVNVDSQRGAANTNDFKGKILRIHPEPDGTYTIPDGNLFPKGMAKTRPEIYVMGVRNPYRIAVNPRTSVLYWGEPGPDAGRDSIQGPRGYDEFNQAKKAGNYGWPYFAGNNYAYSHWDFATNTAGPLFDAKAPVNNSPNNTGLNILPPAQPAMIWYPYAASEQFPELGVGGRCAIGGAVYAYDQNSKSPNRFPAYYDGCLFIADWMRNWVMDVRFDAQENFVRTESFMAANGDFRRPIDMTFGKDGMMYMLEYGSVYGAANKDARLVKIEYNTGNRPPVAMAAIIDSAKQAEASKRIYLTMDGKNTPAVKVITGQAPLKVKFSGKGSYDLDDDDAISYQWLFEGKQVGSNTIDAVYTYKKPGLYKAILKVKDKGGMTGLDTVMVKVGNTAPVVTIASNDNKSFYWKNKPFSYNIKITDREDKKIAPTRIKAFYVYNPQPVELNAEQLLASAAPAEMNYPGKTLMTGSDCKACHQMNQTTVGPSFFDIANRYKTKPGSLDKLAKKIIDGGAGSWGKEHVMSAHPQLSMSDTRDIVRYIFSLTDKKNTNQVAIPLHGKLNLKYNDAEPQGTYTIVAAYTDGGGKIIGPLKGVDLITLRHADMNAAFTDAYVGFPRFRNALSEGGNRAYLLLKNVDLTDIKNITYQYASANAQGRVEVRIDSQAGPIVSSASYEPTSSFGTFKELKGVISTPVSGRHDVYIYAMKPTRPNDAIIKFGSLRFE